MASSNEMSNGTMMSVISEYSKLHLSIAVVCLCIVAVLGVVGNCLVLGAIMMSRKLQTKTNCFIASLAVCDLLSSLTLPGQIVVIMNMIKHDTNVSSATLKLIFSALNVVCISCSILTLAVIALERVIIVTRPRELYRRLFSPRNIAAIIVFTWAFPPLAIIMIDVPKLDNIDHYINAHTCMINDGDNKLHLYDVIAFINTNSAIFIILICYLQIYLHVKRHRRTLRKKETHQFKSMPSSSVLVSSNFSASSSISSPVADIKTLANSHDNEKDSSESIDQTSTGLQCSSTEPHRLCKACGCVTDVTSRDSPLQINGIGSLASARNGELVVATITTRKLMVPGTNMSPPLVKPYVASETNHQLPHTSPGECNRHDKSGNIYLQVPPSSLTNKHPSSVNANLMTQCPTSYRCDFESDSSNINVTDLLEDETILPNMPFPILVDAPSTSQTSTPAHIQGALNKPKACISTLSIPRTPSMTGSSADLCQSMFNRRSKNRKKDEMAITKNLLMVVFVSYLCIMPEMGCLFVRFIHGPVCACLYSFIILVCNHCINPFIYAYRHPVFKPVMRCLVKMKLSDIPEPSRWLRRVISRHQ
ncbi:octopamine receptor 2-like [Strongylocentrotus purpuratus]|uniref:G-protein coupled receptors family 1 profile domain-containing protein n=1 Tax=Strongylocentrotus purpuratus TaxID=7668 RepID=A0A7M7T5P1_STRPU|nr:octopamine receptor 2-like [Strongylocentrotus purpuratus]|eukprot:XP_001201157.1 PREDICTED: octopamine receptor 2-like [Strongylocentrotus purpuratus]